MSNGIEAKIIPVIPPIVKVITVPKANSIGVFNTTDPPVIVANQLNIFIPFTQICLTLGQQIKKLEQEVSI